MTIPATLARIASKPAAPRYARTYKPHEYPSIAAMSRNIAAYAAERMQDGVAWYADARADAERLAARHGIHVDTAAQVIAAVSPGMAWERNVPAAERTIIAHHSGTTLRDALAGTPVPFGYRPFTLACAILDGTATLTGDKRQAFAASISTGGYTDEVTVDGHAALLAVTPPHETRAGITTAQRPTGRRYDLIAAAHAVAADALGIRPAQVQAAAWAAWRDRTVARA